MEIHPGHSRSLSICTLTCPDIKFLQAKEVYLDGNLEFFPVEQDHSDAESSEGRSGSRGGGGSERGGRGRAGGH